MDYYAPVIAVFLATVLGIVTPQNNRVTLTQGTVVGLKVFPESSRTPVYTFLGIPYAQPPTGNLRFTVARPHRGWNQTFYAREFKPICPQLTNSIYDENYNKLLTTPTLMNEDCLYLNIWVPESGLQFGNLPVLVIITGEEMSFDWPQNRPSGLDLASEGIVVVTIQYRTNIFGWLSLSTSELPGNFGLHDQQIALKWIQQNILKFGGNPRQVTLLGHGTSGAACGLIHLISPKSDGLFSKVILMSGTTMSLRQVQLTPKWSIANTIVEKLGCQYNRGGEIADCLRVKSTGDLLKAFESVYYGNGTSVLGPVVDTFRLPKDQMIPVSPVEAIRTGSCRKIPILIGICSNEGAFIRDLWIDLAREGYPSLKAYINYTTIPRLLDKYSFTKHNSNQVSKTIFWRYFDQIPRNSIYLLNSLQRLISEAEFEAPFYDTIELLARTFQNQSLISSSDAEMPKLFVYTFNILPSMDMRGKINYFGGASHSSDLPLLMGPSLFQQIARRRFTATEDKVCRRLRQLFTDFLKTGNPTPGRIYDAWQSYSTEVKFVKVLGESQGFEKDEFMWDLEQNLVVIEEMLQKREGFGIENNSRQRNAQNPYELGNRMLNNSDFRRGKSSYLVNKLDFEYFHHLKKVHSFWNVLLPGVSSSSMENNISTNAIEKSGREILYIDGDASKYKHAFFSMLTIVCLLLGILGICVYILKKNHKGLKSDL